MSYFDDDDENDLLTPEVNETYTLATENTVLVGALNDFVTDINNESQKVNDDLYSHEIIPEIDDPEEPVTPGEQKRAKTTAEFVVKTADQLISKVLAAYAKTDAEKLEADRSDINEIAGYFAPYFTSSSFDMPPWLMGTIVAAFVMFDKFKAAGEIRRINLELEAERSKTKELEGRIKELKLKQQEKELKLKVDELEKEVA